MSEYQVFRLVRERDAARKALADLRAKAGALSGEARPSVEESGLGDDYWAGYDGAIADVLALFPEVADERHHVAGLLASEPAERIREADGREFIALADAQRIAREDT